MDYYTLDDVKGMGATTEKSYSLADVAAMGAPQKETGNPMRAALRSLSPVLSSVMENPQGALTAGGQLIKGGARGVKDVLDTGALWAAQGYDKLFDTREGDRVRAMNDAGKADFKRDNANPGAAIGRFGGQMAVTLPAGPLLGAGASAMGFGRVGSALASSGMVTGGPAAPGFMAGAADLALRSAAGGTVGGITAGLVNPDDAAMGAGIGAALPGALQLAGKVGGTVYSAVKSGKPGAGRLLAEALGVTEAELPGLIKAANAAPESLVPGSQLTLSQALQTQGANTPGVKMLERIAAAGPGGDGLLKRYADQGTARMDALRAQGAQTYQGAASEESNRAGNQIGALLRTQAADERLALAATWKGGDGLGGVHGLAAQEGAALQFPLDRMRALVADRMGDGYTGGRAAVDKTLAEAERIGTDVLPGLKPIPQSAGQTQSLEQAVRGQGGIQPGKYLNKEISELGRKQSKTTGLVSQYGRDVEAMATTMHERGFLPDNDPATLLQALRSGGGRRIFADDHMEAGFQRMAESAAGDMPEAGRIDKAVPFKSFQALRSSSGADAARLSEKTGNEVEAGVMTEFQKLLAGRADDAAMGNFLPGESMSEGLMQDYTAARDLTRTVKERYNSGNIAQILRKPVGQNYTLGGDEITNKLWHGGAGLQDDVRNLKGVLSGDNQGPALKSLQQFIMTDAAGKTKGSGDLGAALPRYVETRMPGLLEALDDGQFKALSGVASDIRNADAASAVPGLLGSDTYAKASRAMDGGLLDSAAAKMAGRFLSFKGLGVEPVRAKLADMVMQHKGRTVSELLANPKAAAAALQDSGFLKSADAKTVRDLRMAVAAARAMPILAAD